MCRMGWRSNLHRVELGKAPGLVTVEQKPGGVKEGTQLICDYIFLENLS